MKSVSTNSYLWLVVLLLVFSQGCGEKEQGESNNAGTTDDPFADHVRTTEFRTPEEELAGFKLPPGFEITLYASEPDISKPINMEFDEKGRLWVTQSSEYPMAAPPDEGTDQITVLEDTDGDGSADKFIHFAEGLNIPIGIMPIKNGAIAYSIPNVYKFTDQDQDGKADNEKVLLGVFGHKDTHGMVNNFIRGFDGWIHASHGFTNTSEIAGSDGDSITMVSGNTFRFRPDGSRVEQTTYGRVNPFGYAYDEYGYLYSVDCHSKPIYQLIRGGEYPHFGKKEPAGMGFAPEMMGYELGSTALSGLAFYTGTQFPEEYRNSFYNGDVVTSRINRNTMIFKNGSTPVTKREDDFLISEDPWFRPVDIKIGPDGSIYVADFYNRIIGHYEVRLDHPGRDRRSGRIWKITYTGDREQERNQVRDWSSTGLKELIDGLNHPQLNLRMRLANQLVDNWKKKAVEPVTQMMESEKTDSKQFIQGLWVLHRLQSLQNDLLEKALHHPEELVRVHAFRVLIEMDALTKTQRSIAIKTLSDENAHVQRASAEVLGHFPQTASLESLLALYSNTEERDTHLKYTVLLSIRDHLRIDRIMQRVASQEWNNGQKEILLKAIPDVPSKKAAAFLVDYIQKNELPEHELIAYLEHIGRFIDPSKLNQVIVLIRERFSSNPDVQYSVFNEIRKGLAQGGIKATPQMKDWGISIAKDFLIKTIEESNIWTNHPIKTESQPENPWEVIDRAIIPELPAFKLMWSEYNAYPPTGSLHSPIFELPPSLQMNIFDNDVHNTESQTGISKNVVRIRLEENQEIVAEYRANFTEKMALQDLVQKANFDLSDYEGQKGFIEVVDSTETGSVGIGKLEPAVLKIPDTGPREIAKWQIQAAEIIEEYKETSLESVLKDLVAEKQFDYQARTAAASALMSISPQQNIDFIGDIFSNSDEPLLVRKQLAVALGRANSPFAFSVLESEMENAPASLQITIATVLINSEEGIDYLFNAIEKDYVEADVLSKLSPAVNARLLANSNPEQQQQIAGVAGNREKERKNREEVIQTRIAKFDPSSVSVEKGKEVFARNCVMCHQVNGKGGIIGPQLDGIGNWGLKALSEKILDPNRNVSEAFRTYRITLNDGKILNGLFRREEGEVLVFANFSGQEFTVRKSAVKEKVASESTLMPDNFAAKLKKEDFDALLKYLLNLKEQI